MPPSKISIALSSHTLRVIIAIVCMFFSIGLQFRTQIISNFSLLYGDSYDATIVATILEHWYSVFRGWAHWSELNYFFPHTKTLGQTDGYFLAGVIYSPIRALGFDPYLSSEIANIILRGIGFLSFLMLSRDMFKLPHYWAILAAVLFVLSNNLTIHGQRLQLATISLAPLMGWLLWSTYSALKIENHKKILIYGGASGLFLGAWSITCFYITWFFIYFTSFFIAASFLTTNSMARKQITANIKRSWLPLALTLLISLLSLYPLLSVYLVKAAETGMRPYESAVSNTVPWQGILQVGNENFMFGEIYNKLLRLLSPSYAPSGEYYNTGIAPLLFALFVAGALAIFRSRNAQQLNSAWLPLIIATAITWLGVLNIGGHSAWYFLYHLFPGAKALNVVGAYQLFLPIPIILTAIYYLHTVKINTPKIMIAIVATLLCLEELNQGYITLTRQVELSKSSVNSSPPSTCTAFFVSGWPQQDTITPMAVWVNNYYAHNVTAMLIAELVHLPTVNGIASFNPKDWNFGFPNNADYDERVRAYVNNHDLKNVCKLDLKTREWSTVW